MGLPELLAVAMVIALCALLKTLLSNCSMRPISLCSWRRSDKRPKHETNR